LNAIAARDSIGVGVAGRARSARRSERANMVAMVVMVVMVVNEEVSTVRNNQMTKVEVH
jgi:hypothetical protein